MKFSELFEIHTGHSLPAEWTWTDDLFLEIDADCHKGGGDFHRIADQGLVQAVAQMVNLEGTLEGASQAGLFELADFHRRVAVFELEVLDAVKAGDGTVEDPPVAEMARKSGAFREAQLIERTAAIRDVSDHLFHELEEMGWELDTVVLDSEGRLRFWKELSRRFAAVEAA